MAQTSKMSTEEYQKMYRKLRRIERFMKSLEGSPLSVKKAARYTGLSKSHLYKLTHFQLIPHYKPRGKLVYFLKKDLDKFLIQNRISTRDEIEDNASKYIASKK